jgi:hypothetical protein
MVSAALAAQTTTARSKDRGLDAGTLSLAVTTDTC